ncbi:MAG: hypothetical protein J6A61_08210 [Clostridia bacterium]|nr:hypothetical protein [Clostridia bacterium]
MKKMIIVLMAVIMTFVGTTAYAENGVVGYVYSTDILTFVNRKPIQGFNIGGRTVVIAEDLIGYGFNVEYNDETRSLKIDSYFHQGSNNPASITRGEVGQVLGNVYQTDIKTYYNGIWIQGYNIGGRTAICLEDLGNTEDSSNAPYGYSDYLGKSVWDADNRTISFESYLNNEASILGLSKVYHRFKDNVIYTFFDEFCDRSEFSSEHSEEYTGRYTYSPGMGMSRYTLKPLYFDHHGEQLVIGTVVQNPNNSQNEALMHIENPAAVIELIKTYKTPTKTHDEAKVYFTENYRILKEIENDNYTVLMVENDADGLLLVYINKQGGYVLDTFLNGYKDRELDISFEPVPENSNTVNLSVYPFGGPHGTTTANFVVDLDLYDYE